MYLQTATSVLIYFVTLETHPAFCSFLRLPTFRFLISSLRRLSAQTSLCANSSESPLYFHSLTNSFPRNCLFLIFLQIAGRCHPPFPNSSPASTSSSLAHRPAPPRGSDLQLRQWRVLTTSWALAPESLGHTGTGASRPAPKHCRAACCAIILGFRGALA